MPRIRKSEKIAEKAVLIAGLLSVVSLLLIFVFLLREGLPLFRTVSPGDFFAGKKWQPTLPPPIGPWFGLLPSLWGSFVVTLGAAAIAVPIGIATAVYIAEVAPQRDRKSVV